MCVFQDAIRSEAFYEATHHFKAGDIQEGFKMADDILEGEIHVGGQEHFYLEPQSCIAVPKDGGEELEVFASTQAPSDVQVSHKNRFLRQNTCFI